MLLDLVTGIVVSAPFAWLAARGGRLTPGAALAGVLIAGITYAAFLLAGLLVLGVALALTLAATRAGARQRAGMSATADSRGERRGAANVIANCGVGALAGIVELMGGAGPEVTAVWFVAAIAAGASDTVASELGAAWGGRPRTFPAFRIAQPGTPGAVSVLGTISGLVAALVIALPAGLLLLLPWPALPIVAVCSTAASLVESALATLLEHRGLIGNHALNVINTAAAAALAAWAALS